VSGIREVSLLDSHERHLDRAEAREAVRRIAMHLWRLRADVVVTFGPDGAYGISITSPVRSSQRQP